MCGLLLPGLFISLIIFLLGHSYGAAALGILHFVFAHGIALVSLYIPIRFDFITSILYALGVGDFLKLDRSIADIFTSIVVGNAISLCVVSAIAFAWTQIDHNWHRWIRI